MIQRNIFKLMIWEQVRGMHVDNTCFVHALLFFNADLVERWIFSRYYCNSSSWFFFLNEILWCKLHTEQPGLALGMIICSSIFLSLFCKIIMSLFWKLYILYFASNSNISQGMRSIEDQLYFCVSCIEKQKAQ